MDTARRYSKHYTPDEANNTLPLVQKIVEDIVSLYGDIVERRERLESVRIRRRETNRDKGNMYDEEFEQIEKDLDNDIERLRTYVEELEALSIELKDPSAGLIDFPSLLEDREVFLCWKLGESEIGHWHELTEGFSGRQSLLETSIPFCEPESDSTLDAESD